MKPKDNLIVKMKVMNYLKGCSHQTFSHFFVYRYCSFGLAIQTKWSVDCLQLHSVFRYWKNLLKPFLDEALKRYFFPHFVPVVPCLVQEKRQPPAFQSQFLPNHSYFHLVV